MFRRRSTRAAWLALVVAQAWAQVIPCDYDRSEDVAPGIRYRERCFARQGDGPFSMQILEVDPSNPRVNLLPVRARDRLIGRETLSSMARRYGATAAVNGGYFVVSGAYAGSSTGVYQFNRRVLSGGANRTALLFCEETDFKERLEMDVVNFRGSARAAGGATFKISGMNRQRTGEDLEVFLPQLGPSTLTAGPGVEVALDGAWRVTAIEDGVGNARIPRDGLVLSGTGRGAAWLRQHAALGALLRVDVELNPARPAFESGCRAEDIVGGGPRLVRRGRVAVSAEKFAHTPNRNPRTAVAVTRRGTFLFVTLDGRQARSLGMRLDELARELVALGALEAMNLDGGGSSTMVVNGRVRNVPSDGRERPVSDAILIFSIRNRQQLSGLVDRLAEDPSHISPAIREKLKASESLADLRRLVDAAEGRGLSVAAARLLREAVFAIAGAGAGGSQPSGSLDSSTPSGRGP